MAIIAKELTIAGYNSGTAVYTYSFGGGASTNANCIDLGDISGYTPSATDIISISPKTSGAVDGNIISWITWGSSTWSLFIGSEGHLGKFSVVIKTL